MCAFSSGVKSGCGVFMGAELGEGGAGVMLAPPSLWKPEGLKTSLGFWWAAAGHGNRSGPFLGEHGKLQGPGVLRQGFAIYTSTPRIQPYLDFFGLPRGNPLFPHVRREGSFES
jgi:hypothetical protein